ncbi:MAG: hypothetical protein JSW54_13670 [Fidelibacterota bacterium]|nr:MAG: hypothetical protein JSW54_13670 [Candidatus Neomarinimicrobiota bacterium]
MENGNNEFDTQAALKLLDPRETGIPMVPLADVEQPFSALFWGAIFFGITTAIAGSLISLLTTEYSNPPVIFLLGLFLVSYFIFFVVFAVRGFLKKRQLSRKTLASDYAKQDEHSRRISALERRIQLYKVHRDVGMHVFNGEETVAYSDFNRALDPLLPFESDDPRRQKFNQKLIAEGIIQLDQSDPSNWTVTYNPDFEVPV